MITQEQYARLERGAILCPCGSQREFQVTNIWRSEGFMIAIRTVVIREKDFPSWYMKQPAPQPAQPLQVLQLGELPYAIPLDQYDVVLRRKGGN